MSNERMFQEQAIAERLGLERPEPVVRCVCGGKIFYTRKIVKYGIECIEPCKREEATELGCTDCNNPQEDV